MCLNPPSFIRCLSPIRSGTGGWGQHHLLRLGVHVQPALGTFHSMTAGDGTLARSCTTDRQADSREPRRKHPHTRQNDRLTYSRSLGNRVAECGGWSRVPTATVSQQPGWPCSAGPSGDCLSIVHVVVCGLCELDSAAVSVARRGSRSASVCQNGSAIRVTQRSQHFVVNAVERESQTQRHPKRRHAGRAVAAAAMCL